MQVPAYRRSSHFFVIVALCFSALVLSACGSGSSSITTTTTPPPRATATISVSPSAVMPGQTATLTWSSTNATSCTGSGSWSGTQPVSGSLNVVLQGPAAQKYILLCSGAGLSGESSVTLDLSPNAAECTASPAVRSARSKMMRAIVSARQAVARGAAGQKKSSEEPKKSTAVQ